MSGDIEGRKLADLRVVDLRSELEKRGLDKTGNKQILCERLEKALKAENIDSANHTFPMEAKETVADGKENGEKAADEGKTDAKEVTTGEKEDAENDLDVFEVDEIGAKMDENAKDNDTNDTDKKNSANPNQPDSKVDITDEDPDDCVIVNADNEDDPEDAKKDTEAQVDQQSTEDSAAQNKENTENAASEKQQEPEESPATDKVDKDKEKSTGEKADEGTKKDSTVDSKDPASKSSEDKAPLKSSSSSKSSAREKIINEQNRNLWITNISQNTRATELKQALSEHGKVIGAKVVINARHPAACCYGYVKMETASDADNCIAKLNNTELNGQIIRIERVRPDHLSPLKHKLDSNQKDRSSNKTTTSKQTDLKDDKDKSDGSKDKDEKKVDKAGKKEEVKGDKAKRPEIKYVRSRSRDRKSRELSKRSTSRSRTERSLSNKSGKGKEREREMLTFDKIKDERERERLRERERILRDRRREEVARQREIERHQRSESLRLEREREKLRRERERLEREKAEFMQFERERQKIEREKLELERIELERAKLRMQEEERRAVKRSAPANYRERERSYEDRKRLAVSDRHFDEAPPPPRYEPPSSLKSRDPTPPMKKFSASAPGKDYNKSRMTYDKRDTFPPKRDYEDRSHPTAISRTSTNLNDAPKVSRYNERERSPHFRSVRRPIPDTKPEIRNTRAEHRYSEPTKEAVRYDRTSSNTTWSPQKVFNSSGNSTNKQWTKDGWRSDAQGGNDRWSSTNPSSRTTGMTSTTFSSGPGGMVPNCPPPPGINNYVNDRFDNYKSNMPGMRKY